VIGLDKSGATRARTTRIFFFKGHSLKKLIESSRSSSSTTIPNLFDHDQDSVPRYSSVLLSPTENTKHKRTKKRENQQKKSRLFFLPPPPIHRIDPSVKPTVYSFTPTLCRFPLPYNTQPYPLYAGDLNLRLLNPLKSPTSLCLSDFIRLQRPPTKVYHTTLVVACP
jgi:hypothetical protein